MTISNENDHLVPTAAAYEAGAERLLDAIEADCDPALGFAEQVESSLRATLSLFAAEPELARGITRPISGANEGVTRCYFRWLKRYAALLRRAAATRSGPNRNPEFLEPVLVGGIFYVIAGELAAGRDVQLPQLLPGLLEFTLAYYN